MSGTARSNAKWRLLALSLGVVALAGCTALTGSGVSVSRTGDNPAPTVVPPGTAPDDEVIGRREHPRIIASYGGIYSDREAEIMIARLVGRLLAAADQPNAQYQITILDTPEVNAFALPGGYIYVTRGILALASDTSELAAVLAHEIAHVTLRHARARTDRSRTNAIVDRVMTAIFGAEGSENASDRSQVSMAAFSRSQELEADDEGIKIAGKAGYDPHAAARFLGVMSRFARFSEGDRAIGDDFLSSHPSTPQRIEEAVDSAQRLFGPPGAVQSDRAAYLAAVEGLTFGDNPSQGSVIGRRFVHPGGEFTFTVPQGYSLQNANDAVVGVAGDGEAVRFDSADVPSNVPLTEYLRSGWIAGLNTDSVRAVEHNGIEMATGIAQTDQWHFRVSVARLDGEVYRFIFAAKSDSQRFVQGAEATLESFRRTTQSDLTGIRRLTLDVVTAGAGDTADSLARRMRGLNRGAELFYIINGLYPGDPVEAGRHYKIVTLQ